ncbi:MAG: flagellar basal body protein, partial [Defluviitaleaceae bacterium]|nr:flagellar basal body protein [Defluviitaleaceae bacterium]
MFNKLFVQADVLGAALQASALRNDVLANNIANADVPGFKSKDIKFEDALAEAVDRKRRTGRLSLNNVQPEIYTVHKNFEYRI